MPALDSLYTDWYNNLVERSQRDERMDNKALILNCALELFYRRGYDAVGVQEIVEAAGITKPTLYYYFGSKQGLLQALIEEKGELLLQQILEIKSRGLAFEEGLRELTRAYARFAGEEHHFYFLMLGLMYSPVENEAHKVALPFITKQYELIVGSFAEAGSYLGNMNGRQEQFAIGYLGTINCYMLVHREKKTEEVLEDGKIDALLHQFLHGIYS